MRGVWRARAMKANKIRRKGGCVPGMGGGRLEVDVEVGGG